MLNCQPTHIQTRCQSSIPLKTRPIDAQNIASHVRDARGREGTSWRSAGWAAERTMASRFASSSPRATAHPDGPATAAAAAAAAAPAGDPRAGDPRAGDTRRGEPLWWGDA